MEPFSKLSVLDEALLDPADEEDEAEVETFDPAELEAAAASIKDVVDSCSDVLHIVDTPAEVEDVSSLPGKPLPCKITASMITDAAELLPKMRGLAKALRHGTVLKNEWEVICKNAEKNPITLRRSVVTRWNTTTGMMDDILLMEPEVLRLVSVPGLNLDKFRLNSNQWLMARSLSTLLRAFILLTKKFSQSNTPLIAEVLPAMDELTNGLDKLRASKAIHPMVRYSAALTQKMVNKLYRNSDESDIYRVAMGEYGLY